MPVVISFQPDFVIFAFRRVVPVGKVHVGPRQRFAVCRDDPEIPSGRC